jgi:hypothetical protein
LPEARFASEAVGVGHRQAASVSDVPGCPVVSAPFAREPEPAESIAVAVGQDEKAGAEMRCADRSRAEQIPLRIEPEYGQVPENEVEPSKSEGRDVLQEHEAWSNVAKDLVDERPDPPLICGPEPKPGARRGLTREARSDDIHEATPRSASEGANVVPDRSARQERRFHPGHDDGRSEGVPLDVTHRSVVGDREGEAELEAGDSGT